MESSFWLMHWTSGYRIIWSATLTSRSLERPDESLKAMLIAKLYALPEGITETYIHPAVEDREMVRLIPSWEKRTWEFGG